MLAFVAFAALLGFLGSALAQAPPPVAYEFANGRAAAAGEVIVRLRPDARPAAIAEIERAEDVERSTRIGDGHAWLFRSRSRSADALVRNLRRRPDGTHCAGVVGAVGNDGLGIVGVNWTASIMGIKFLDAGGNGTAAGAIDAIEFAIQARQALGRDASVRVLSNSWVLAGPSQALRDQITRADLNEMLFVVAAGNFGTDNDTVPYYPQSYATSSMLSVAATSAADLRWGFSNVGPGTVHLGAPGIDIVSTTRNGGYAFRNGTSMAAPHVAGAAALMLAVDSNLTVAELREGILGGVDPLPTLQGLTVTGGRLNLDNAVRSVQPVPDFRMDLDSPASRSVTVGGSASYSVAVTGSPGFADLVSLGVMGLPGGAVATFTPGVVSGNGASTLVVHTSNATPAGAHLLTITGRSSARAHTMTVTLAVLGTGPVTLRLERDAAGHLLLSGTPPVAGAATWADAPALARAHGNPWRVIGTWAAAPGTVGGALAGIRELEVWLGLRNSDDQGTAVDIRAALSVNGAVVATGEAACIRGLTRNPARAREVIIPLGPQPADSWPDGDLALTISARVGTGACPGHAWATGVRLYYGSSARDSGLGVVVGF
jgi:hypothetical protein